MLTAEKHCRAPVTIGKVVPAVCVLQCTFIIFGTPAAHADGGRIRFVDRCGDKSIAVFTSPTPLRTGEIDVSILIQDAAAGTALVGLPIVVRARSMHSSDEVAADATSAAATNKLMCSAILVLPKPGTWRIDVTVAGLHCERPIQFEVDVVESSPAWLSMAMWIGWPAIPIALFGIHQILVRKRRGRPGKG